MKLWLDDIRPAPPDWTHCYTVQEAQTLLLIGEVEEASLDHDLGACDTCLNGMDIEDWLERSGGQSMPHCEHFGDGVTLCNWMAETGTWPKTKPRVHSANPVGRARMQGIIDRYFPSAQTIGDEVV